MTELATRTPVEELVTGVRSDRFKEQLRAALPEHVTVDRFVRITITALQANPDIATADRDSVIRSLIQCAQIGLYPDGREAALVIYNTKSGDSWIKKAQLIPMIGGFRKIAGEHGWTIRTQVVYENDYFAWEEGLNERLDHTPTRPGMDRGRLVAAYAIGVHRDGRREFQVFTEADVDKAKSASKTATKGPWVDWTDRMWEKTAGRRLFAKLPLADEPRVVQIVEADRRAPEQAMRALYGPARPALTEAPPVPQPAEDADQREAGVATPGAADGSDPAADEAGESAAPPPTDPEEEPIDWPDEPPTPEPGEPDEGVHAAALAAANVVPPSGKYSEKGTASEKLGPLTLAEIHEVDPQYIAWAAGGMKTPKSYIEALLAFTRFYMPDAYQAALAKRQTGDQS